VYIRIIQNIIIVLLSRTITKEEILRISGKTTSMDRITEELNKMIKI
jgi:hypothetical protein